MSQEALSERVTTLFHRVEALEKKIDGNGRAGLVERIAAMERAQALTNRLLLAVFTVCVGILFKQFAR